MKKYKKLLCLVIFPVILLIFWFCSSLLFNRAVSFSVLRYSQNKSVFNNFQNGELKKDFILKGEFIAKDNYLGIVNVKFNNFHADYQKEELLSFKIKEKGAANWYSTTDYRIGYLGSDMLFPFGFLPISESKNKTYQFQVSSTANSVNNTLQVSSNEPVILISYQYPKSVIKGSKYFLNFFIKKTTNSFTNSEFLLASLIYLYPLIVYLIWLKLVWKSIKIESIIFLLFLYLIFVTSVFVVSSFSIFDLFIGLSWILYVIRFKLDKNVSFLMSLFLILTWFGETYFNVYDLDYKINFWTYFFLVFGSMHYLLDSFKNRNKVK